MGSKVKQKKQKKQDKREREEDCRPPPTADPMLFQDIP